MPLTKNPVDMTDAEMSAWWDKITAKNKELNNSQLYKVRRRWSNTYEQLSRLQTRLEKLEATEKRLYEMLEKEKEHFPDYRKQADELTAEIKAYNEAKALRAQASV